MSNPPIPVEKPPLPVGAAPAGAALKVGDRVRVVSSYEFDEQQRVVKTYMRAKVVTIFPDGSALVKVNHPGNARHEQTVSVTEWEAE